MNPTPGDFVLDGWNGRTRQRVIVLSETPKRFRIATAEDKPVKLGGRDRWLHPGETVLVPKHAVVLASVCPMCKSADCDYASDGSGGTDA